MIRVNYEKYYNDRTRTYEVKAFNSLQELADWLFGMVKGKYKKSMFFIDPDAEYVTRNGKLRLDSSCIKSHDGYWSYWIHQIEKDDKIIYSCGTYTNGIYHWNDEIREWLHSCRERLSNPQFNFG